MGLKRGAIVTIIRTLTVRFSEVDSMGIVWHGHYAQYFEEAREEFGRRYGLEYLTIFGNGYYTPLVDLNFSYKRPLKYGDRIRVEVDYIACEAAKLLFEHRIYSLPDNAIVTTGNSTQVFLNEAYELQWSVPEFYEQWKIKNRCKPTNQ